MTTAIKIRAGDAVLHRPSGERWLVAAVTHEGSVFCAGWPCTWANIADCDLIEATSDERHIEMVFACARIGESDPRRSLSLQHCTLMMGRGERVPPDIAQQVLQIIEGSLLQAKAGLQVAARCAFDATSMCEPGRMPEWANPADVQLQIVRMSELAIEIGGASLRVLGCTERVTSPHTRRERPAPPAPPQAPIPDVVLKS